MRKRNKTLSPLRTFCLKHFARWINTLVYFDVKSFYLLSVRQSFMYALTEANADWNHKHRRLSSRKNKKIEKNEGSRSRSAAFSCLFFFLQDRSHTFYSHDCLNNVWRRPILQAIMQPRLSIDGWLQCLMLLIFVTSSKAGWWSFYFSHRSQSAMISRLPAPCAISNPHVQYKLSLHRLLLLRIISRPIFSEIEHLSRNYAINILWSK